MTDEQREPSVDARELLAEYDYAHRRWEESDFMEFLGRLVECTRAYLAAPAQAEAREPPGCPTPGACSCPSAHPTAAQDGREVAWLIERSQPEGEMGGPYWWRGYQHPVDSSYSPWTKNAAEAMRFSTAAEAQATGERETHLFHVTEHIFLSRAQDGLKRWPFVLSPGFVAMLLHRALADFEGDMLAAVRNVFIEQGLALATAPSAAAQDGQPNNGRVDATQGSVEPETRTLRSARPIAAQDGRELDVFVKLALEQAGDQPRTYTRQLLHEAADAIAALRAERDETRARAESAEADHARESEALTQAIEQVAAERARAERAEADARQLRSYLSECARAVGARVDPSASLDFMGEIPSEVRLAYLRAREQGWTDRG